MRLFRFSFSLLIIIIFITINSHSICQNNDNTQKITLSFAGDCTLGGDKRSDYQGSFQQIYSSVGNNNDFFFKNVKPVFSTDDLTIVNLEGPLTNASVYREKTFAFRGSPDYAAILKAGCVDIVNLANNHSYDYFEQGHNETLKSLDKYGISYFGDTLKTIKNIKGVNFGFIGFLGWATSIESSVKEQINLLKKMGADIIIVSFHWGEEGHYKQNSTQEHIARFTIDNGADLVIGHHPHVIEGVEDYKGKRIVYSLGNFVFGGNHNPRDKDSFIFQACFTVKQHKITGTDYTIIPCSVSSVSDHNNYQPTPLTGDRAEKIRSKIIQNSTNLKQ